MRRSASLDAPPPALRAVPCRGSSRARARNVAAFGPNVCVFSDTMSQATIQADLDNISTQQVPVASQFDGQRYAVLFEPGTYGSAADPLVFQVGYYTEVAGLGLMPQDTVVNGAIEVYNNLCTAGTTNCNSDDNFWRSLSNLTLNVDPACALTRQSACSAGPRLLQAGCANSAEMWSVSQAAPIRRAIINGSVVFQDYCASENSASGGFIADSKVSGDLDFYGNQQYMVRNSAIGGANGCPNGLWNMVYSGVQGAPSPVFTGQCQQNTVLSSSPVTEEEPFLYTDSSGNYRVFVPAVQHNTSGTSWASGTEAGTSIPLSRFFVAGPSTPTLAIDLALAAGKNLILTPGVYDLDQPIVVSRSNTVVLGQGFATLVPQHGNAAVVVLPDDGVKLSGLIIDAGPVKSPVLLSVGVPGSGSAGDPDLIQDVFFRIGGAESTPVSATVSLLDNASDSIIDDVWAWRADHGGDVGWTQNTASTGVAVTGNDVTAYGLAVEHYQKNEVTRKRPGRHGRLLPKRTALRPAQPVGLDGVADPGRLPGLPGQLRRRDLPGLRHGQLRGLHRYLGHAVRRRGVPGSRHARRPVPQPRRGMDRWFGRRQVDHQRRRRPGNLHRPGRRRARGPLHLPVTQRLAHKFGPGTGVPGAWARTVGGPVVRTGPPTPPRRSLNCQKGKCGCRSQPAAKIYRFPTAA